MKAALLLIRMKINIDSQPFDEKCFKFLKIEIFKGFLEYLTIAF